MINFWKGKQKNCLEKRMKTNIKEVLSFDDENEDEKYEEDEIGEKKFKKEKMKVYKKEKPKKEKLKEEPKKKMNKIEIQPETYLFYKVYKELKKIRKLLSTFKEVEIGFDNNRRNLPANYSPIVIQPLKKLADYKESPVPAIPEKSKSENNPLPKIPENPAIANPINQNEIVLDNSQPKMNLKRCPSCNKKLKKSKVFNINNAEARQTLFCKRCGWHTELRFAL